MDGIWLVRDIYDLVYVWRITWLLVSRFRNRFMKCDPKIWAVENKIGIKKDRKIETFEGAVPLEGHNVRTYHGITSQYDFSLLG